MNLKTCRTCNKPKPLSEYHKRSDRPDGHSQYCKVCSCARRKNIYYKNKVTKNPSELQKLIYNQIENYVQAINNQLPTREQREHLKNALNIIMKEIDNL